MDIAMTIENPEMFTRVADAHRDMAPFFEQVGVQVMSHSVERLETVLSTDNPARTGNLMASLNVGATGGGGGDTIFEVAGDHVRCGTSVPYAAQVHFGGIIEPRNAKALAIPLGDRLKRDQMGPRELDPTGKHLRFMLYTGGKPNVFGLLIDDDGDLGYGEGPLFALAYWVPQEPKPFLYIDKEDEEVIAELWREHMGTA